jgi:hypothetical protein
MHELIIELEFLIETTGSVKKTLEKIFETNDDNLIAEAYLLVINHSKPLNCKTYIEFIAMSMEAIHDLKNNKCKIVD